VTCGNHMIVCFHTPMINGGGINVPIGPDQQDRQVCGRLAAAGRRRSCRLEYTPSDDRPAQTRGH
jgi:hypothetical protein